MLKRILVTQQTHSLQLDDNLFRVEIVFLVITASDCSSSAEISLHFLFFPLVVPGPMISDFRAYQTRHAISLPVISKFTLAREVCPRVRREIIVIIYTYEAL